MIKKESLLDLLIHDLTGPLSIVSTSASRLLNTGERNGSLTDGQRHGLERILRNAQRATALLHEMVEISQSEEGVFQREPFGVEEALQESLVDVLEATLDRPGEELNRALRGEEFRNLLESHGIFIEVSGKYGRSSFSHDPAKIKQILRNLIGNAMKYRHTRMDVSISGDTDLIISVKDDGVGIPLEDQRVIFERFVRLPNGGEDNPPGFGLGLTGVKALVDAMAGEISLNSGKGCGACFTVRIPPL